ncbi:MAG: hypothetical protein M3209_15995 [Acidobacteriota bacterium]|nr:hypothetical protein [Acidobacteriota bacterium]
METLTEKNSSLALAPLGAGDLIDRAVRLYRRNFFTLVRISALPVLISAIGGVLWTFGWNEIFTTERETSFAGYALLVTAGALLWILGSLMTMMVMGAAARNLVRHLLWGEPISVGETFRSLRQRFFSLLAATVIVGIILWLAFVTIFYGFFFLVLMIIGGAVILAGASPFFAGLVAFIVGGAATVLSIWLFFLIAGRFAYVPQVMMVEGQGVFASIGRSASLASKNAWRLAALFIFTSFATYSALMIFLTPLLWYAQANGIPLFSFEPDSQPVWFSIAVQVIWQSSLILLAPVWMLGLSLLYVDERVRQEAYDIELMAARSLGEMPPLAPNYINPLRPAIVVNQTSEQFIPNQTPGSITTLNLK